MIVYPKNWDREYNVNIFEDPMRYVKALQTLLNISMEEVNVPHLAYSGGIDSTIMLSIMTRFFGKGRVHTYIISSREDHPDILFARQGAEFYGSIHHEFIVAPEKSLENDNPGDNAVRQFFDIVSEYTFEIVCCDGIDEYMCGYYDHMADPHYYYSYYLSHLNPDSLVPLDKNSGGVSVYLPYLESNIIDTMVGIDLPYKVSVKERKKLVVLWAKYLNIPDNIIYRNKYGFVDAFLEKDK